MKYKFQEKQMKKVIRLSMELIVLAILLAIILGLYSKITDLKIEVNQKEYHLEQCGNVVNFWKDTRCINCKCK